MRENERFISIGIEVETFLELKTSVLFGFRKCIEINSIDHPLRIPEISVTITPSTSFYHCCSVNTFKPMCASHLPMFLDAAET